jgi:hypothetical protein
MKRFFAIKRDGKILTSGNTVGMADESLIVMLKSYGDKAEAIFADERLSPLSEVGNIFGMTWQQILEKQQKIS